MFWSDWLQRVYQALGLITSTLTSNQVHTFTSIASGSTQTMTVAVSGAGVEDDVTLGLSSLQSGLIYQAYVSAANTVTIACTNTTTGAITPTAGNIRVTVRTF